MRRVLIIAIICLLSVWTVSCSGGHSSTTGTSASVEVTRGMAIAAVCGHVRSAAGATSVAGSFDPHEFADALRADAVLFDQAGDAKTAAALRSQANTSENDASYQVTVYLRDGLTPSEERAIKAKVTEISEPGTVAYISKAQAYEEFKRIFANQPDLVAQANPAELPASFRSLAVGLTPETVSALQSLPGVDRANVVGHVVADLRTLVTSLCTSPEPVPSAS